MMRNLLVSRRFHAVAVVPCLAVLGMLQPTTAAWAQPTSSAAAVKELAQALDAAKLDSIAAPDPEEEGRFVAALYFPGAQLLVVSAKYAAPTLLVEKIKKGQYRDIYIDLNSAFVAGTKIFVIDQSADGLMVRPGDNQAPDSYENGDEQLSFDGEWRKAKMSEDQYMKAFADADHRYAKILALLTAQAREKASVEVGGR
ncbi:MAG TPA: hypothetical protein VLD67_16005 [Vicinamibacterales bacterium]|nr:hypothetical protein [Vicinamibacterales bacterium]